MARQNEQAANIPKRFSYRNTFESYMNNFLPFYLFNWWCRKYDLFTNKNSKYLFYRFNGYVKAYNSHRRKIKHTLKIEDSVAIQKIEARCKQFLVEKIIYGVEFTNPYATSIEQKPDINDTVESNYRLIRRVITSTFSLILLKFFLSS